MNDENEVGIAKFIVGGIALLFFLVVGACSMTTVDVGERGVKVRFGEVIGEPLPEGLYFVNPFTTHVKTLSVRTLKWENQTEAYTKDVQKATIHFTVNYNLEPQAAAEVYRTVGDNWSGVLIAQVLYEEIKRQIGQIEAVELIGKRDQSAREIERLVTENLANKHILVTGFRMTNIDYTTEFEKAVEAKMVAQQRAIEEQNRTVQIQQQANQTVITAKAAAESMTIRAQALEQNPKLVEWEAVQKWDGKLPIYSLGGAVPFITVPTKP